MILNILLGTYRWSAVVAIQLFSWKCRSPVTDAWLGGDVSATRGRAHGVGSWCSARRYLVALITLGRELQLSMASGDRKTHPVT